MAAHFPSQRFFLTPLHLFFSRCFGRFVKQHFKRRSLNFFSSGQHEGEAAYIHRCDAPLPPPANRWMNCGDRMIRRHCQLNVHMRRINKESKLQPSHLRRPRMDPCWSFRLMTNEGPGDRGVGSRGVGVGSRGGQRGGGSGDGASTAIQYAHTLKEQTPCRPTAQIYFFCHQSLQLAVQL